MIFMVISAVLLGLEGVDRSNEIAKAVPQDFEKIHEIL